MVFEGAEMSAVLQGDDISRGVSRKQTERNTFLWVLGYGEAKISCRAKTKRAGRQKVSQKSAGAGK